MTKPAKAIETPLEDDPVWDLVDKATTQPPSSHFARSTVQLVREQESRRAKRNAWWKKLIEPAPLTGIAAAAAAVAIMVNLGSKPDTPAEVASFDSHQAIAIQEMVETEMLMVAADNPSEFSDQELVALLGF